MITMHLSIRIFARDLPLRFTRVGVDDQGKIIATELARHGREAISLPQRNSLPEAYSK